MPAARGGYTILSNTPAVELAKSRRGVGRVANSWGNCFWHLSVSVAAQVDDALSNYIVILM